MTAYDIDPVESHGVIEFEARAPKWDRKSVQVGKNRYTVFQSDLESRAAPGHPDLPRETFTLAIPDAAVAFEIRLLQASKKSATITDPVIPAGREEKSKRIQLVSDIYDGRVPVVNTPVRLLGTRRIAGYRVADIELDWVAYHPLDKHIEEHDSVKIRLSFRLSRSESLNYSRDPILDRFIIGIDRLLDYLRTHPLQDYGLLEIPPRPVSKPPGITILEPYGLSLLRACPSITNSEPVRVRAKIVVEEPYHILWVKAEAIKDEDGATMFALVPVLINRRTDDTEGRTTLYYEAPIPGSETFEGRGGYRFFWSAGASRANDSRSELCQLEHQSLHVPNPGRGFIRPSYLSVNSRSGMATCKLQVFGYDGICEEISSRMVQVVRAHSNQAVDNVPVTFVPERLVVAYQGEFGRDDYGRFLTFQGAIEMKADVSSLEPGQYTITWQVIERDSGDISEDDGRRQSFDVDLTVQDDQRETDSGFNCSVPETHVIVAVGQEQSVDVTAQSVGGWSGWVRFGVDGCEQTNTLLCRMEPERQFLNANQETSSQLRIQAISGGEETDTTDLIVSVADEADPNIVASCGTVAVDVQSVEEPDEPLPEDLCVGPMIRVWDTSYPAGSGIPQYSGYPFLGTSTVLPAADSPNQEQPVIQFYEASQYSPAGTLIATFPRFYSGPGANALFYFSYQERYVMVVDFSEPQGEWRKARYRLFAFGGQPGNRTVTEVLQDDSLISPGAEEIGSEDSLPAHDIATYFSVFFSCDDETILVIDKEPPRRQSPADIDVGIYRNDLGIQLVGSKYRRDIAALPTESIPGIDYSMERNAAGRYVVTVHYELSNQEASYPWVIG
jgi:hypothetical protein